MSASRFCITISKTKKNFTTRLKNLIHVYIDCTNQYEDTVRIIYNAAFGTSRHHPTVGIQQLEKEHIRLLEGFFREGLQKKVIRKKPVHNIVMHFLGSVTAYSNYCLLMDEPIPANVEKTVFDFLCKGIGESTS